MNEMRPDSTKNKAINFFNRIKKAIKKQPEVIEEEYEYTPKNNEQAYHSFW